MNVSTSFAHDANGILSDHPAQATVFFTAHNRRELVIQAIELALRQTLPLHIMVGDDASSDGTREAVLARFPDITYQRSEEPHGPCFHRNRGMRDASTEIIFPLDDDSLLISPHTLEQAMRAFDDPTVAIAAIPFRNALQSDFLFHDPEWARGKVQLFDFIACAHGIRRKAAIEAGGWFEPYFYMGEETDIALRLYDRGFKSVIVVADPLEHMQPPARRSYRPDFYGYRNLVLFTWVRMPGRRLPLALIRCLARGLKSALRQHSLRALINGQFDAVRTIVTGNVRRDPVQSTSIDALFAERREAAKR